jgi:uncharacterized protein
MTKQWLWSLVLATPVALSGSVRAETLPQVLKAPHRQRVYDFAGVLAPAAEAKLRNRIHGMEQRHLAQGAVILVHRVDGDSIEGFAKKVLNRWGVGERGRNNGFVLLAAMDQHKWRLETGTGLAKKIPDSEASRLMRSAIVPAFRQKHYAAGLDAALVAIQKRASGSSGAPASAGTAASPAPDGIPVAPPVSDPGSSGFPTWLVALVAVPLLILGTLFRGRSRGWGGWGRYSNQGSWWNNGLSSSNSSSSPSSASPSSASSTSSDSSGDYGGGSGSGSGASGSW